MAPFPSTLARHAFANSADALRTSGIDAGNETTEEMRSGTADLVAVCEVGTAERQMFTAVAGLLDSALDDAIKARQLQLARAMPHA